MSSGNPTLGRRLFLKGVGGVSIGLPMLESFLPRTASAATAVKPFLAFISSANGVVQARAGEVESWWPTQTGALTKAGMTADKAARTTGELADYADRMLIVRGLQHALGANGCNHASACAQLLTGTAGLSGNSNQTTANSESVDTIIARQLHPDTQPLFLHVGMYQSGGSGFNVPSYISYAGAKQQRPALDTPAKAYERITGRKLGTAAPTPAGGGTVDTTSLRRKSVNDFVRAQLKALQARPELTADDKHRLDQHFTAIRDVEIKITDANLTAAQLAEMQKVDPSPYARENRDAIQRLHMDLMLLAISSGYTQVAVLQVGDREDDHEFMLDGTLKHFHDASHRKLPDSVGICKKVDRIQITAFKYFLDKMAATMTPTGSLLDQGATVNTNQLGTGPDHSMKNLPYIVVGSANGFLNQGKYIDAGGVSNSLMLNTLAAAVGVKTSMGGRAGNISAMVKL